MEKERLLAFTDGVIAIIITIMVLELKVPQDAGLGALAPVIPVFLSYVLSFTYVSIYWSNHHHSGCRSFRSPPAGWGRIILPRSRPRSTASYC